MRNNILLRYAVLVTSVVLLASLILLFPAPSTSPRSGYSYLSRLAGRAAEDSRYDDELAPDCCTVTLPDITLSRAEEQIEAEDCPQQNDFTLSAERRGYSGSGYVSALMPESPDFTFQVQIPYTQHYRLTICAASDSAADCSVFADGKRLTPITLHGEPAFLRVHLHKIFLEQGTHQFSLRVENGCADLDYISLCDESDYHNVSFDIDEAPCNPDASPETKRLYAFLREQWGQSMLTGQYASDSTNRELNLIYQMTGQLPAIRFSLLGTDDDRSQIESAIDWNVYMHGIVGLMWQWNAPGSDSVYAKDSDFHLQNVLRRTDPVKLAALTPEQIDAAAESGALDPGAAELLHDIDAVSASLMKLRNMDIPVLWRPLHEASGGWYWWGAYGNNAYFKLWTLVYQRMTVYHHLDNLIWIWNGQSSGYMVPHDKFDIASVDAYLQPDMEFGSRCEQFSALALYTGGKKMLALSECSALPDPARVSVDQAYWSFFGVWYGKYLMKPDGSFSDAYYSSLDLYNLYNSDRALSLNDFLSLYQ